MGHTRVRAVACKLASPPTTAGASACRGHGRLYVEAAAPRSSAGGPRAARSDVGDVPSNHGGEGVSRYLFVLWDGGGNVPPQLGIVSRLVARGHDVRVLAEPSLEPDVTATGASFVSLDRAPHRDDRSPESDFVRDWEARTPIGEFARTRDRVLIGPSALYAHDVLAELE